MTPGARVALRNDSYALHLLLPTKVDPLVSLMKVEKVPDSTYDMVGGLDAQIKEIKMADPCWGKPDIIAIVDVPDQDVLTQLVMSRIHAIEGVTQTDTHLVYRLKEAKGK